MSDTYAFRYDPVSVYGNVVSLVRDFGAKEGVHLDLGCGHGAIAEPLRAAGLSYVGLDLDGDGLASLRERGFESASIDLHDENSLRGVLAAAIGDRPLASISIIDTLEHVTNGPQVLAVIREVAIEHGPAPLIISVPNATHVDVGIKMLLGRWDWTETGLLDHTHVAFYTSDHLTRVTAKMGWGEVARADYRLTRSDQHFPADSIALAYGSNIGAVLHRTRHEAGDDYNVNQFVRAYLPGACRDVELVADRDEVARPLLTTVIRTQGRRASTLRDTLLCLEGQTSDDFEILLVVHRASAEEFAEVQAVVAGQSEGLRSRLKVLAEYEGGRAHPLNVALDHARGHYIAALDDDDLVFAHWVETFAELAAASPGRVLRTVAVEQDNSIQTVGDVSRMPRIEGNYRTPFPETFDLLAHTVQNFSPLMTFAFPRQVFHELGLRFDDSLPVCEDWDMILRAASVCGVADAPEVTAIYRKWDDGDASNHIHSQAEWLDAAARIVARMDSQPLILPPGYFGRIRDAVQMRPHGWVRYTWDVPDPPVIDPALVELVAAQAETLAEVYASTSWRATAPLRLVTGQLLRVRGAIRSRQTARTKPSTGGVASAEPLNQAELV